MRFYLPLFLALSTSAFAQDGARAQDGLTPTDVLPMGRFTANARLVMALGEGTLDSGPASLDGDIRQFLAVFEAAAGLGMGFEIEAQIPVAFSSELSFEESGVEFTEESKGLGDLTLGANYAIIQQKGDEPQLIIGAFILIPTGDDDPSEPEITGAGIFDQPGEEGGIGDGAFGYGGQIGISKRFGSVEPYFVFRYFVHGESDVDDIETDHADVASLIFGMEIHGGDQVTIDLRVWADLRGEEVEEDDLGNESTEEKHASYGFQGRVFLALGSQVAIVAGVGISAVEDHAISEEANFDLTDTWVFGAEFGLHIVFGK
ncbi:MAG TPA: transporter [Planctomycetota bacterium]